MTAQSIRRWTATSSPTYTRYMIERNRLPVDVMTEDLYHSGMADEILSIKTYYEQQWLDRGLNIKYIKFHSSARGRVAGAGCGDRAG